MKRPNKWMTVIGTSLSLGIAAAAVQAHPEQMGGGMETGAQGNMLHGMQDGMKHEGMGHGGMQHSAMSRGNAGSQARQQLMTPEERTAVREKMRNAKTPEERQQIAAATRTEMQKRAKEKGITLPEHRALRGHGGPAAAPTAPAETEHAH